MSKPTRDISKLPKWAQAEISRLTANEKHWKDAAMEMETGDTNVFQRDYGDFPANDRKPMKRDSHILFVTDDTEFEVGFRDGELEVTVNGSRGHDRLAVLPRSSNVVVVGGRER